MCKSKEQTYLDAAALEKASHTKTGDVTISEIVLIACVASVPVQMKELFPTTLSLSIFVLSPQFPRDQQARNSKIFVVRECYARYMK